MFLNLQIHKFETDIIPFIRGGIILDTSVFDEIINGLIKTRISKQKVPEYTKILNFLDLIKCNNRWEKFYITPHILTEVCTHFRNKYSKDQNYRAKVKEIFPLLENMMENSVSKENILSYIDLDNPVVEIGDISIFITASDLISSNKKVALLSKDARLNDRYKKDNNVMVMDYHSVILNAM